MRIFHTTQDVIECASIHAPTKACQTYMAGQGIIKVFKGMKSPAGLPGWIVDVQGTDKDWLIGVWLDVEQQRIKITYPDRLPLEAVEVKGPRL